MADQAASAQQQLVQLIERQILFPLAAAFPLHGGYSTHCIDAGYVPQTGCGCLTLVLGHLQSRVWEYSMALTAVWTCASDCQPVKKQWRVACCVLTLST